MAEEKKPMDYGKTPAVAAALSMIPGLGLLYIGYALKGISYMLIMAALIVLQVHASGNEHIVYGLLIGGFYIYQIFDAHNEARKIEKYGREIGQQSTLFNAITILTLGILFQLAELHIVSYRKLSRFWPMIIIAIGIKIIVDYIANKEDENE